MTRIGMGIVGAGFIGPHHVDAVRRLGYVDVLALADMNEGLAKQKADALSIPQSYGMPPRFTDVALPLMCAETGDVFIDGVPLTAGAMVPAGSFTVQWRLRGTCPFGAAGPGLHGDVDVRAVRDDDACVQAIVVPPPAVLTAGGRH